MPREHKLQENQVVPPPHRDVLVRVTTTVECDVESRLQVDEIPPLPSRMSKFYLELTEEEHQMKQDLDI